MEYKHLIPQNVGTVGARRIGIIDKNGNRVGQIPLGSLDPPDKNKKLYSFGLLSDVHLNYTTGEDDFKNVLTYMTQDVGVEFICISGDLSDDGTDARLSVYKDMVEQYAGDTPIYVSAGNHDAFDDNRTLRSEEEVNSSMLIYTGNPLYYSFEYKDDVYIFIGLCSGTFSCTELQWLYETLEKYRNRRCFLFQHVFAMEGCGNAFGLYNHTYLSNTAGIVFKSLLKHYHNVIWFHGHSHTEFKGQQYSKYANLDTVWGCYSVHVPSCAAPRTDSDGDFDFQYLYENSEGYVVDVYDNGIHLRGRDFVAGEFLPVASYWLDTTLKIVEANTFVDETGVIIT